MPIPSWTVDRTKAEAHWAERTDALSDDNQMSRAAIHQYKLFGLHAHRRHAAHGGLVVSHRPGDQDSVGTAHLGGFDSEIGWGNTWSARWRMCAR